MEINVITLLTPHVLSIFIGNIHSPLLEEIIFVDDFVKV